MPSLTIKNLPEDLHSSLKRFAAANHRSINQEVILSIKDRVEKKVPLHEKSPEERLAFIRANRVTPKRPFTREELDQWRAESRS